MKNLMATLLATQKNVSSCNSLGLTFLLIKKKIYKKEYIFKGSSDVSESESIPPLFEDEFNLYDPGSLRL